ncbi:hypothetical protein DIPPA_09818 [Diplonema papillatum]|nr:hypothetical protein DIPPA_09818 [Diplonema papillatum]
MAQSHQKASVSLSAAAAESPSAAALPELLVCSPSPQSERPEGLTPPPPLLSPSVSPSNNTGAQIPHLADFRRTPGRVCQQSPDRLSCPPSTQKSHDDISIALSAMLMADNSPAPQTPAPCLPPLIRCEETPGSNAKKAAAADDDIVHMPEAVPPQPQWYADLPELIDDSEEELAAPHRKGAASLPRQMPELLAIAPATPDRRVRSAKVPPPHLTELSPERLTAQDSPASLAAIQCIFTELRLSSQVASRAAKQQACQPASFRQPLFLNLQRPRPTVTLSAGAKPWRF